MSEIWLPVVGYEGIYEVSSQGRIKSLSRPSNSGNGGIRIIRERILKPCVNGLDASGNITRMAVSLYKEDRMKVRRIHRLVLEAFVGPRPDDMDACHWDDDPTNNRLINLRWDTRKENGSDKIRNSYRKGK